MNLEEWNAAIFREAVLNTGRPGDPLFLYVDEDTLAAASGEMLTPEEAVSDFCAAFNSKSSRIQFWRAVEEGRGWAARGGVDDPPFVHALAMTVLAVAMPAIGDESGVYARQRQLLGLSDLRGGIPDGYDIYVPELWRMWNSWLESTVGARFGTPTAVANSARPYQGWARSQSFIRSRDKEDVLAYFETLDRADERAPEQLLSGLALWLGSSPSLNAKLQERVLDAALRDEFLSFLEATWRSWANDVGITRRSIPVGAALLWDDDARTFDLIVRPQETQQLIGREIVALDGLSYEAKATVYISSEMQDVEDWIGKDVDSWIVAKGFQTSWESRQAFALSPVSLLGWVQVEQFEGQPILLLFTAAVEPELRALGVQGESVESPISGWKWIRDAELSTADPAGLRDLLGFVEHGGIRDSEFVGGLAMTRGNVYLEQEEPDLVLRDPATVKAVTVDGNELTSRLKLRPLPGSSSGEFQFELALSSLGLNPGDHRVDVKREGDRLASHRFSTTAPMRNRGVAVDDPAYEALGGELGYAISGGKAPRSIRGQARAFFVVSESGEHIWRVSPTSGVQPLLTELGVSDDGSYLFIAAGELSAPITGPTVLVARIASQPREVWRVIRNGTGDTSAIDSQLIPMQHDLGELSGFIASASDGIRSDVDLNIARLKQGMLSQVYSFSAERDVSVGLPPLQGRKAQSARPRPSTALLATRYDNPYNSFLDWLSERSDARVTQQRAIDAFEWLWRRHRNDDAPAGDRVLEDLAALGHVHLDRRTQSVWIAPTVAAQLPRSNGHRVFAGARPAGLVEALMDGEASWIADGSEASEFLADLVCEPVRHPAGERPLAPDVYLARWGSRGSDERIALEQLGIHAVATLHHHLLDQIPDMSERLNKSDLLARDSGARLQVWRAQGSSTFRGSWRSIGKSIPSRSFVKVVSGRHRRYAINDDHGLREIGWVFGRWWYEFHVAQRRGLVLHSYATRQLFVPEELPMPAELRKALVAHSGILPRRARLEGNSHEYLVFENVQRSSAKRVGRIFGDAAEPEALVNARITFDGGRNDTNR